MTVSFLFKDFLRLQDVGEYLNQYEYSYDPEVEEDYYRLKDTILDLYHENKLNIVFHYDDFATIKTLRCTGRLGVEEIKDKEFECYISGYFHVPEAKSLIENELNLAIIPSSYGYYLLHDRDRLPIYDNEDEYKIEVGSKFTSIEFGDSLAPSVIDFSDLRFPKADLDKLFNNKKSELKSIKDELVDVKAQNAKLLADKERVVELEKELAAVKTELKEQTDILSDDKSLSTRSQNLAAKIILALLDIAELDKDSPPYQYDDLNSNNCIIHDQITANGMKVGQQKIGYWLDLAINQTTDK